MRFVAAFRHLGYELGNHQNEWSAEKADGVRITLWQNENKFDKERKLLFNDIRNDVSNDTDWLKKSGNLKRKKHLARGVKEFDGRVDVIILRGEPGKSYEDADPWICEKRSGRFGRITEFSDETWLFRAEVQDNHLDK